MRPSRPSRYYRLMRCCHPAWQLGPRRNCLKMTACRPCCHSPRQVTSPTPPRHGENVLISHEPPSRPEKSDQSISIRTALVEQRNKGLSVPNRDAVGRDAALATSQGKDAAVEGP